jgi:iron complex transport system substrate-binding protein
MKPRLSRGAFLFWKQALSLGERILGIGKKSWRMNLAGAVLASALLCAGLLRAQTPSAPGSPSAPNAPNAAGAQRSQDNEKNGATKAAQESAPAGGSSSSGASSSGSFGAAHAYREVIDETGRTVRLPQPVERIVSLAPNLTETVYALGLQDHLVGDTEYCDYPPEAQKKQKVGGTINPSIEEVAALRPDVVLMTSINRFETERALDNLNIPVYATDPHNVQEILSSTIKLADALGVAQNGVTLAGELQQRLSDLQQRIGELAPRRVLFVVWTEPLISVGKNTFIADALRKAGAVSIVETTQDWPKVSLEEVVRLQPEFLVFTTQNDERAPDLVALSALPGWRSLEAVRNHRFVMVSDAVNRPAPRIVAAIEDMARQLHPEAFVDSPGGQPLAAPDKLEKPNTTPEKIPPAELASLASNDTVVCADPGVAICNR